MFKFAVHSSQNHKVNQSAVPVLPLGELPHYGECIERMYEEINWSNNYDEFGDEILGQDRLFADDIDWDAPAASALYTLTDKLMKTPFEMVENPKYPSETKKALNAHIVTGISVNLQDMESEKHVLVLCAGNGEDIMRLLYNSVGAVKSIDLVGVTQFHARAKYALRMYSGDVRATTNQLENLGDFVLRDSYDLIVCHHGIHQILKSRAGEKAFVSVLDKLGPNGVLIGDKVDMMGLDTLEKYTHLPSHGIELVNVERESCVEGMMWVRVLGTVWPDPVLSDRRLLNLVPSGFSVQLLQGKGAFDFNGVGDKGRTLTGRFFTPPSTVRQAARRPEVRVMTYVEIRRGLRLPMIVDPGPLRGESRWVPYEDRNDNVLTTLSFVVNRGKHFQARDISYLGDGYSMFARKGDGLRCRVAVMEDGIYMAVDTNPEKFMRFSCGKARPGAPILRLQCEYYPDRNYVELNDPIALGPETPVAFLSRLNQYDAHVRNHPWISYAVRRKRWYTTLQECVATEGGEEFVVMPVSAPTPLMRSVEYETTARFVKRRPTVDLMIDGKIYEVYVDTKQVKRPRPDKKSPNSLHNQREVENSITLPDLLEIETIDYDVEKETACLEKLDWNKPLVPTVGVVIALRYPNRHNPNKTADRNKVRLLSVVGYAPPRKYNYGQPTDFVPHTLLEGWGYDFGVEGSSNKKGDGPRNKRLSEWWPEVAYSSRPKLAPNYLPEKIHFESWFYMRFPLSYGGARGAKFAGKRVYDGKFYYWQGQLKEHQVYVYGPDKPGVRACIVLRTVEGTNRSVLAPEVLEN